MEIERLNTGSCRPVLQSPVVLVVSGLAPLVVSLVRFLQRHCFMCPPTNYIYGYRRQANVV